MALPSHDTFSRVFRLLDPRRLRAELRGAFPRRSRGGGRRGARHSTARRCGARSTAPRAARRCTWSPPSAPAPAWRSRKGAVADGENETLAARALLETLGASHPSSSPSRCTPTRAPRSSSTGAATISSRSRPTAAMFARSRPSLADPPEPLEAFETTDADHGPRRDPPPPGNPHSTDWLFSRPPLRRRATPPRPRHPRPRRGHRNRRRPHQRLHPLLPLLGPPHPHPPAPSAPTGRSRTACTGSSTSPSTRTAPETTATTAPEDLAILRRLTLNLLNKARPKMSAARKRKRYENVPMPSPTIVGQMRDDPGSPGRAACQVLRGIYSVSDGERGGAGRQRAEGAMNLALPLVLAVWLGGWWLNARLAAAGARGRAAAAAAAGLRGDAAAALGAAWCAGSR